MDRAQAPALALLLAACAWLPACGLNQSGVAPFSDTIAYPASAVLDRNSDWLFVTNSNADLRYNDGTLMALSLKRAEIDRMGPPQGLTAWPDCDRVDDPNPRSDDIHKCCWDALDNNILNCDERFYVGPEGGEDNGDKNARIGSFAAGMVLQRPKCPIDLGQDQHKGEVDCEACSTVDFSMSDDRLLIGVRGDTSLTWVDVTPSSTDVDEAARTPPTLNCTADPGQPASSEPFATCNDAHRIIQAESTLAQPTMGVNPTPVPLPDEPYALAVDDANGLLFIGHLTGNTTRPYSGGFSLFDIAPRGVPTLPPPDFIAPFQSPFPATALGSVGVTALNVHTDPTIGHLVLASSRFFPQVSGLGTTATCPDTSLQAPARAIAAYPSGASYASPVTGATEMRGIQFVEWKDTQAPTGSAAACGDTSVGQVPVGYLGDCTCTNGLQGKQVCRPDDTFGACVCSGGAFVLQRNPPALIRFVESGSTSSPTDVLETCGSPTFLDQHDSGLGPRLFVTCFADGEIYVFDPAVPTLEKTFPAGRGPSGLIFDAKRPVAYVVGFGDNNISVTDLAPGSRTEYHVVQRMGFPRTTPR